MGPHYILPLLAVKQGATQCDEPKHWGLLIVYGHEMLDRVNENTLIILYKYLSTAIN